MSDRTPSLFDEPAPAPKSVYDLYREECAATAKQFPPQMDGETFEEPRDGNRLRAQLEAVRTTIADGKPYTLAELERLTGAPQASVSARLRDLRKPKFGGHDIRRDYIADGVWSYRMVLTAKAGKGD